MSKKFFLKLFIIITFFSVVTTSYAEEKLKWPRFITNDKGTMKAYQPQIESWDFDTINYRMAVEVKLKSKETTLLSALWVAGKTDVDMEARLVRISGMKVEKISSDEATSEQKKNLSKFVNTLLAKKSMVISLERMLADAANKIESLPPHKNIKTNKQVPRIIVQEKPSILLTIDGKPLFSPVGKTGLEVVINANQMLFYLKEKKLFFLFTGQQWVSSSSLKESWKHLSELPDNFTKIPDTDTYAYVKDLLKVTSKTPVHVVVAEAPAELIIFEGPPKSEIISGTNLMVVTNTRQNVFIDRSEGVYYYLTSGRWLRSKRLAGPWEFAGKDLPEDFSRIPEGFSKKDVLKSVPQTPEAKEAVIEAMIPRKITVKRDEANVIVTYSGEPEFNPVKNTDIEYAVNTSYDVIIFNNKTYCCHQGVWFIADYPKGPFKVCDSIPEEIYSIPPENPKYHLTYARVYESTSETVTFGYTSGYTGMYISNDTVVYGTGYTYPGNVYYINGCPYYYGFPYTYWSCGYSYYWYYPPYYYDYYPPHYYGRVKYVEGKYGHGYIYERGDYKVGRGTGNYKGADFVTWQAEGPHGSWGESIIVRGDDWVKTSHRTSDDVTRLNVKTSEGGKGVGVKGDERHLGIFKTGDDDIYVSKDGKLYRHDGDGWSSKDGNGWQPYQREDGTSPEKRSELKENIKSNNESQSEAQTQRREKKQSDRTVNNTRVQSDDTRSQLQRDRSARSRGNRTAPQVNRQAPRMNRVPQMNRAPRMNRVPMRSR